MRQVKKQHFKGKFWNWGPVTLHMEQPEMCVQFVFFKNHSTLMSSTAPQGGKKLHGTVPLIIKRSLSLRKRQKVYISNSIYENVIKDFKQNY